MGSDQPQGWITEEARLHLDPCVLVLRSPQQGYHGIIGVALDLVPLGKIKKEQSQGSGVAHPRKIV